MKFQEYPIEGFGGLKLNAVCDGTGVWFKTFDVLAALGVKVRYAETALSWLNGRYRKTIDDVDCIDQWGIYIILVSPYVRPPKTMSEEEAWGYKERLVNRIKKIVLIEGGPKMSGISFDVVEAAADSCRELSDECEAAGDALASASRLPSIDGDLAAECRDLIPVIDRMSLKAAQLARRLEEYNKKQLAVSSEQ